MFLSGSDTWRFHHRDSRDGPPHHYRHAGRLLTPPDGTQPAAFPLSRMSTILGDLTWHRPSHSGSGHVSPSRPPLVTRPAEDTPKGAAPQGHSDLSHPFHGIAAAPQRPRASWLTRWKGNPSFSGAESGFAAITEPLLDHDYFSHDYVLGRTATPLVRIEVFVHLATAARGSR